MAPRSRKKASDAVEPQTQAADDAHYATLAEQQPDPSTEFDLIALDRHQRATEIVHEVADSTTIPESRPHIANPSSVRRPSHAEAVRRPALPAKLSVEAGDMWVNMIDKGDNLVGIGIQVTFPDHANGRPTDEEKAIIRRHIRGEDGQSGFTWNGQMGMWHKPIIRDNEHPDDVPPSRPVAIRLDAEGRVKRLAEALKLHQADPVGYQDMVRQRREQSSGDHIPD